MMRRAFIFGLLSALTVPSQAFAIRDVILGNQPVGPGFGCKEAVAALNVEERVYLSVGGLVEDVDAYFKGGPKALNNALRRFAAIPANSREIILLPVPARPLVHKVPIPYDWRLDLSAPRGQPHGGPGYDRVTLTVYIAEPLPPAPADPKAVRRWIADLGSDDFKTRERAAKELTAIGPPAARLLREGLKKRPSAEAQERIEKLLAGMSREIRPDVLELPAGVTVVSLDDLLDRALNREDPSARSNAVWALVREGATADVFVPVLQKMLKAETDQGPLSAAAWAAGWLGAGGRPLLPALRKLAMSKDKAVVSTVAQSIDQIERAKPQPVPEADAKKRATIRKEIKELAAERSRAGK